MLCDRQHSGMSWQNTLHTSGVTQGGTESLRGAIETRTQRSLYVVLVPLTLVVCDRFATNESQFATYTRSVD